MQRPGPPLLIGGGGPRIPRLAGREADIVGIVPRSRPDGSGIDLDDVSAESFVSKVQWVREGAGERFESLELNTLLQAIAVTDDRARAGSELARAFRLSPEAILDTPYALIGPPEAIEDTLLERRAALGISYYALFERDMDAFAPIAARLAGR